MIKVSLLEDELFFILKPRNIVDGLNGTMLCVSDKLLYKYDRIKVGTHPCPNHYPLCSPIILVYMTGLQQPRNNTFSFPQDVHSVETPMCDLLKTYSEFVWDRQKETAFTTKMKDIVTRSPVLAFY